MKLKKTVILGAAIAGLLGSSTAIAAEQFIGLPSYRVGPYAAGGSGIYGGWIDYMQMINERDGGINGVAVTWRHGDRCIERFCQPQGLIVSARVLDAAPRDDKRPLRLG